MYVPLSWEANVTSAVVELVTLMVTVAYGPPPPSGMLVEGVVIVKESAIAELAPKATSSRVRAKVKYLGVAVFIATFLTSNLWVIGLAECNRPARVGCFPLV